jgi:MerR family copper efflux transcriptional regulator
MRRSPLLQEKALRPGEVARLSGVSTDTLRHYERVGVLPRSQRTEKGYRVYSPSTLDRVRLVRHALRAGFTLSELRRILAQRDRGKAPCLTVRALAREKLQALEVQIREMHALRKVLERQVREWGLRLRRKRRGEKAYLLEELAAKELPILQKGLPRKGEKLIC